jgi:hypothetical protein
MRENPVNRVRWSGSSSVQEVEATLERCGKVEIQLPPDFHHALYMRIHPESRAAPLEQIDVSNGAELLHKVASIRGLNEIGELEERVRAQHISVHLLSPVPLIILSLPDAPGHA